MLLDFRVRNFRSFREEFRLNLIAGTDSHLLDSHSSPTGLDRIPRVLNWLGIYGPNASGKTNVIRAFQFMSAMVGTSMQMPPDGEHSLLAPHRFADDWLEEPSMFEATFLIEGKRFQYGFEMTRKRIVEEWLLVYETAKPQVWFSRTLNKKTKAYDYTYSNHFTGKKKLWEESTRKEVLYLSAAIQLNNTQLLPLFKKLTDNLVVFPNGAAIGFDYSAGYIEDKAHKTQVTQLLSAADIGISDISLDVRQAKSVQFDFSGGQPQHTDLEMKIPQFSHQLEGKSYVMDFGDESKGTQLFFSMSGPLLDILEKGRLLVVDELDASLHPLLVRKLVALFHDPEANQHGAQIIFTTHDVSLLDPNFVRRDQVWFTEKDNQQSSHLYPLLDFSPRKGEALEKGYLQGRYGAIPILGELV